MLERLFHLRARSLLMGLGAVAVQLLLGRPRDVPPLMYVAAAAFAADFLIAR